MNEPLVDVGLESPRCVLLRILLEACAAQLSEEERDILRYHLVSSEFLGPIDAGEKDTIHGFIRAQALRFKDPKWVMSLAA